ncbi:MAG TPA: CopD family protein [Gemmatimonadales bacterium]|nr:CopD family protein [Gemmatimonadales bacterium]
MPPVDGGAVARWLWYAGIFAAVGAAVIRLVVYRGTRAAPDAAAVRDSAARAARKLGFLGCGLILAAEALRLYFHARGFLDPDEALSASLVHQILRGTAWGTGWSAQVYVTLLLGIGLLLTRRRGRLGWTLSAVAAAGVAVTAPLTGHAMASPWPVSIALPLQAFHILAGSLWLGTLFGLVVAGFTAVRSAAPEHRTAVLAGVVNTFSPLALTAAGCAILAGVILARGYVGSWAALAGSEYGRTLLIKIAVLLLVLALGAYNWRRMRPRMGDPATARLLRRSATTELALGALLLAVTAALSALPAPNM